MALHRVIVSFSAYVEAEGIDEVNKQVNILLDELATVETTSRWDDCSWSLDEEED